MEITKAHFLISTAPERLDITAIHQFLSQESYWGAGIPLGVLERAIANSLNFGLYDTQTQAQVGFARIVSDYATFGYLADVFIIAAYRGQGLSKWLMECVMAHPDLQGLRLFVLMTRDAHGLYEQSGFQVHPYPERVMTIFKPNIYQEG